MPVNLHKGKLGEDFACKYLVKLGYHFVTRNFRSRLGEVDLIFTHQKTLVFIEVKSRIGSRYGTPAEAVTPWKLQSVIKASQYFKFLHPELPDSLRIDVVAVQLNLQDELVSLEHIANVTL